MKIKYNAYKVLFLMGTGIVLMGCGKEKKAIPIFPEVESQMLDDTEWNPIEEEIIETQIESIGVEENTLSMNETEIITEEAMYSDEQVIEYMNRLGDSINECTDSITVSVKKHFIIVVDFLFYDGTIGGRTFDSLSEDAKEKALNIFDSINTYIDTKFPNFKSTIGEKYGTLKEYLKEKKEKFTDWVGEEKLDSVENYLDMGKDKAGEIYESSKEKVKNWYEKFRQD